MVPEQAYVVQNPDTGLDGLNGTTTGVLPEI
jgi:hypothetical protein